MDHQQDHLGLDTEEDTVIREYSNIPTLHLCSSLIEAYG